MLKLAAIVYLALLIPFLKKDYEVILACSLILMRIPGTGSPYAGLYFLPVLLLLFRDRDFHSLAYLVPLFFINYLFGFYNDGGILYQYFFLFATLLCFVILGLFAFMPKIVRFVGNKKENNLAVSQNVATTPDNSERRGKKMIRFGLPAVLFLVVFLVVIFLSKQYFSSNFLVVDDGREYALFLQKGFVQYVFPNSRPIAAFFMGIGFSAFGANWHAWVFYVSFFVACLITVFYILLRTMKIFWVYASLLSLGMLFSRLNWYFYACCFGVMESLSLIFCILGFISIYQYLKQKKLFWFAFSLVFFLVSAFSHERYFPTLAIPCLVAIFNEKNRARKIMVPIAGLIGIGAFFSYRFFLVGGPLFRVTGNQQFEMDFGALFQNAWHVFSNSISINEPLWYMSGITNAQLGLVSRLSFALSGLLFGASTLLSFIFIFVAFSKKQTETALFLISLWVGFLSLVAAASTTSRSETRWEYSVFALLLVIFSATVQFGISLLPKEERTVPKIKSRKFWSSCSAIVLAAAITSFNGLYSLRVKEHFYINDYASMSDGFYQSIYLPYLESGKEKLIICSDDFNRYAITYLPMQWGNQESVVVDKTELYSGKIDLSDAFVVTLDEYNVGRIVDATDYKIDNSWIGKEFDFVVVGDVDSLTAKIMETIFPVEEPNGFVIYVNESLKVSHTLLNDLVTITIPLELGKINHVKFVCDYTYNSAKAGTGLDIRDLAIYIVELGA